jgi:hypothetical protein
MGNETCLPRFAFIPSPLLIDGRPELNQFPLNIMFGCAWNVSAHALYVPRFDTYTNLSLGTKMTYVNERDLRALVVIEYSASIYRWRGSKYFYSERLSVAVGNEWHNFFIHLTMVGCDPREVYVDGRTA